MARNVSLFTSNWTTTGLNVSVPQFSQAVTLNWTDDAGTPHTWSGVVKFPDILITMYGSNQAWTIQQIQDIIYAFGRKQLGVDS